MNNKLQDHFILRNSWSKIKKKRNIWRRLLSTFMIIYLIQIWIRIQSCSSTSSVPFVIIRHKENISIRYEMITMFACACFFIFLIYFQWWQTNHCSIGVTYNIKTCRVTEITTHSNCIGFVKLAARQVDLQYCDKPDNIWNMRFVLD